MASTARQMIVAVGQTVGVNIDGLTVDCIVVDVKSAWGKERLQVRPIAGSGEVWIEMSRVKGCSGNAGTDICRRTV